MSGLPEIHYTVGGLVKRSFQFYSQSFASALMFVVLASFIQNAYLGFGIFPASMTLKIIIGMILALFAFFFWCLAIRSVQCALSSQSTKMNERIAQTLMRFPKVLIVAIIYFALFVAAFYWMRFLNYLASTSPGMNTAHSVLELILVGLPMLVLYLLLILAIPKVIADNDSVGAAVLFSIKRVWRGRFKGAFLLYLSVMVLLFLVIPTTRHAHWLLQHHLKVVFDLAIFVIFAPLLINFMLMLTQNPLAPKVKRKVKHKESIF